MSQFPIDPAPSSLTIKSVQPTLVSTSHSLKRNARSRGGQRWGLSLDYQNRTRDEWAKLFAFAIAQRGQFLTFDVVPAILGKPRAGAAPATSASQATASGRSVPVSAAAGTTIAKLGDLIKFANHTKVYMLVEDAVANGSGAATLTFEPALYASVASGESVILNNVPMRCAFASDAHESPLKVGGLLDWNCELVEVLP